MRLYQLYDFLTRFEFTLRYYKGKEYLVLEQINLPEEVKFGEFERNNFYLSKSFVEEKLISLKSLFVYFNDFISSKLESFKSEYYHADLFRLLHQEFANKGINCAIDDLVDSSTKILFFLSLDIQSTIRERMTMVDQLLNRLDFSFVDEDTEVTYVLDKRWNEYLSRNSLGEITNVDWWKMKANKWPDLSQSTNYNDFIKHDFQKKFEDLKLSNEILSSKNKLRIAMFVKLLNVNGFFITKLTTDQLIKFSNLLTERDFNRRDFTNEEASMSRWELDYGGKAF